MSEELGLTHLIQALGNQKVTALSCDILVFFIHKKYFYPATLEISRKGLGSGGRRRWAWAGPPNLAHQPPLGGPNRPSAGHLA